MRRHVRPLCLLFCLGIATTAHAGWKDWLGDILGNDSTSEAASQLTAEQAASGVREALAEGTRVAVTTLGQADGFWGQQATRIPLPQGVQRLGDTLRKVGAGNLVDEFHLTLNRAAERAVPEAAQILSTAVRQMSVEDAIGIVRGPDDAATQYFRRTSADALFARLRPLVVEATDAVGVTQQYKRLTDKAGPLAAMAGRDVPNLDDYVTGQALDTLFAKVAEQEAAIRENPAARTTEILREVFGRS